MPFPRRLLCLALVSTLAFSLEGCATLKKMQSGRAARKQKKTAALAEPLKPVLIGRITLINENARFALVDLGSSAVPRSGTALKAMSGGVETGVLAVGE